MGPLCRPTIKIMSIVRTALPPLEFLLGIIVDMRRGDRRDSLAVWRFFLALGVRVMR